MVKYVPLSAGMLNPCSNTLLAATTANTPSDITGAFGIGLGFGLMGTRIWTRR